MARAFEQLRLRQVRGPDVLVAAPGLDLADVRLHLVPHGLAVGQEEGDAGAHVVREGEQAQLPPQPPMVARPRLLKALEVRVELRLRREQRPVDALQLRPRLVAAPVRPRHRRQPEGPDLPRGRHVPAAAEVGELGVRAQPQRVAARPELIDQFQLERLRREARPRLRDRDLLPDEAVIALDLLAHLPLDLGQVVGRERPRQQEVVVEARVDRRADRDLPVGEALQHDLRQHVRRRVAHAAQPLRRVHVALAGHRAAGVSGSAAGDGAPSAIGTGGSA